MLGARIKQGRLAAGLSQRELGRAVGLSAMALSKYENDQIKPSSDALLRLGKALGVRTEYFFREPAVALAEIDFRKHAGLSDKDEKRALEDVREQLERWLVLEAIIPASWPKPFVLPAGLPNHVASLDEVEAVAEHLREAWKLGSAPIGNLVDKMEEEGLKVILTAHDGGKKFDGLVAKANEHTVVVVSKNWPGDRQRFTLAHELGHLMLHDRLAQDLDPEKACHRFAGAFLVPKAEALRALGESRTWLEPQELFLLKHEWGLSMNSWINRALELGILTASAGRRHKQFFAEQREGDVSWRELEPGQPYPKECPTRFVQLVYRALGEDLMGESKASELLGVKVSDLRSRRRMEDANALGYQ